MGPDRTFRGRTDDWLTPPGIVAALGLFDLDPCAAPDPRPWPTAARHLTPADDGLTAAWAGRVWLNPPYGPETRHWLARLAAHGDGIALVFARVETRAFHEHVWPKAAALLFFRGRLRFHRRSGRRAGSAGGPSVLIAYGPANAAALRRSELPGRLVHL